MPSLDEIASMTHRAAPPNPAQPYVEGAKKFAGGGLADVLGWRPSTIGTLARAASNLPGTELPLGLGKLGILKLQKEFGGERGLNRHWVRDEGGRTVGALHSHRAQLPTGENHVHLNFSDVSGRMRKLSSEDFNSLEQEIRREFPGANSYSSGLDADQISRWGASDLPSDVPNLPLQSVMKHSLSRSGPEYDELPPVPEDLHAKTLKSLREKYGDRPEMQPAPYDAAVERQQRKRTMEVIPGGKQDED